jgi:hypothetical protein
MEFIIVLVVVIIAGVFIGYKLKKMFKNKRECYEEPIEQPRRNRGRKRKNSSSRSKRRDRSDSFDDW